MGYCIELNSHDFKIKKKNISNAFNELKKYIKTHERPMWVSPREIIDAEDFYEAFYGIRYPLTTDENGDYVLAYFSGEKLGDDKEILNSIASYVVPNSYIEFQGEDGDVFRLEFDGNVCNEVWN